MKRKKKYSVQKRKKKRRNRRRKQEIMKNTSCSHIHKYLLYFILQQLQTKNGMTIYNELK